MADTFIDRLNRQAATFKLEDEDDFLKRLNAQAATFSARQPKGILETIGDFPIPLTGHTVGSFPAPLTSRFKREEEFTPEERAEVRANPHAAPKTEGLTLNRLGRTAANIPESAGQFADTLLSPARAAGAVKQIAIPEGRFPGAPLAEAGARTLLPESIANRFIGGAESPESKIIRGITEDVTKPLVAMSEGDLEPALERMEKEPVQSLVNVGATLVPLLKGTGAGAAMRSAVTAESADTLADISRRGGRVMNPMRATAETGTALPEKALRTAERISEKAPDILATLGQPVKAVTGGTKAIGRGIATGTEKLLGGLASGAGSKAARMERLETAAGRTKFLKPSTRSQIRGFENQVLNSETSPDVVEKFIEAATDRLSEVSRKAWDDKFATLKIDPKNPPNLANVRQKMFDDLRSEGLDVQGFAEGKTRINWDNSTTKWKGKGAAGKAKRDMAEAIVEQMDELGSIQGSKNVKDYHQMSQNLWDVMIDAPQGANLRSAKALQSRLISRYQDALTDAVEGFRDMQNASSESFKLQAALHESFNIKSEFARGTGFQRTPSERIMKSTQNAMLDALGDNQNAARRLQLMGQLSEQVGIDFPRAIARLRVADILPQGRMRRLVTGGGLLNALGITAGAGGSPVALAKVLGAFVLSSPRVTGDVMRGLGAIERVAKNVVTKIEDLQRGIPIDLHDEVTIAMAIDLQNKKQGDILGTLGGR